MRASKAKEDSWEGLGCLGVLIPWLLASKKICTLLDGERSWCCTKVSDCPPLRALKRYKLKEIFAFREEILGGKSE